MSMDEYVREYLGSKLGVAPSQIESYYFSASPGRAYSEYTVEDFSATIHVTLVDGLGLNQLVYLWGDDAVAGFLNGYKP